MALRGSTPEPLPQRPPAEKKDIPIVPGHSHPSYQIDYRRVCLGQTLFVDELKQFSRVIVGTQCSLVIKGRLTKPHSAILATPQLDPELVLGQAFDYLHVTVVSRSGRRPQRLSLDCPEMARFVDVEAGVQSELAWAGRLALVEGLCSKGGNGVRKAREDCRLGQRGADNGHRFLCGVSQVEVRFSKPSSVCIQDWSACSEESAHWAVSCDRRSLDKTVRVLLAKSSDGLSQLVHGHPGFDLSKSSFSTVVSQLGLCQCEADLLLWDPDWWERRGLAATESLSRRLIGDKGSLMAGNKGVHSLFSNSLFAQFVLECLEGQGRFGQFMLDCEQSVLCKLWVTPRNSRYRKHLFWVTEHGVAKALSAYATSGRLGRNPMSRVRTLSRLGSGRLLNELLAFICQSLVVDRSAPFNRLCMRPIDSRSRGVWVCKRPSGGLGNGTCLVFKSNECVVVSKRVVLLEGRFSVLSLGFCRRTKEWKLSLYSPSSKRTWSACLSWNVLKGTVGVVANLTLCYLVSMVRDRSQKGRTMPASKAQAVLDMYALWQQQQTNGSVEVRVKGLKLDQGVPGPLDELTIDCRVPVSDNVKLFPQSADHVTVTSLVNQLFFKSLGRKSIVRINLPTASTDSIRERTFIKNCHKRLKVKTAIQAVVDFQTDQNCRSNFGLSPTEIDAMRQSVLELIGLEFAKQATCDTKRGTEGAILPRRVPEGGKVCWREVLAEGERCQAGDRLTVSVFLERAQTTLVQREGSEPGKSWLNDSYLSFGFKESDSFELVVELTGLPRKTSGLDKADNSKSVCFRRSRDSVRKAVGLYLSENNETFRRSLAKENLSLEMMVRLGTFLASRALGMHVVMDEGRFGEEVPWRVKKY